LLFLVLKERFYFLWSLSYKY